MNFNKKNITLNPLQLETLPLAKDEDCNVIVEAPTSSGKTIVAEQFLSVCKGRGLYLSPLKALTTEKLKEWSHQPFSVTAITSDYPLRGPVGDLVLMTTEALDSKSRSNPKWLQEVGTIIFDEAHLLGVSGRGDAAEVGLTRVGFHARIVFLSATMPNCKELGEWLTGLNGRPTKIVRTTWRPVNLRYHYRSLKEKEWLFDQDVIGAIREVKFSHKGSSIIVFVHSISKGNKIAKKLGVPFHNSRLNKGQRAKLESDFRKGICKLMVSTSTLAWGINMPCDVGIIVGAHRGWSMVDPIDLKQMAGRIGRYGLSSSGDVYFLFKRSYLEEVRGQIENIHNVRSVLSERLYFHICSLIVRDEMTEPQIVEFLNKTLGAKQGSVNAELVHASIKMLKSEGILKENGEPTSLAKASAFMYVDPLDIKALKSNLQGKPKTPELIARAFANVPSRRYEITIPRDDDLVEMDYSAQTMLATGLKKWLSGFKLPGAYVSTVYLFKSDVSRWIAALKVAGLDKGYAKNLELCLVEGIPYDMTDIVSVKGIGRVKALALAGAGIYKKEQIIDSKNSTLVANILGPKLYSNVVAQLRDGKILLYF